MTPSQRAVEAAAKAIFLDWRPVIGWEARYEVSNSGLVRRRSDGRELKQWRNADGYPLVRLSNPRRCERVHRIVATAFIPNPGGKPFVNHIDCVRSNNSASNLEWCTQGENLEHSSKLGRMQRSYWTGRRSPSALLTDEKVREIRRLRKTEQISLSALGNRFGISKRTAERVVNGSFYRDVQ